jgi:hypothetical protein
VAQAQAQALAKPSSSGDATNAADDEVNVVFVTSTTINVAKFIGKVFRLWQELLLMLMKLRLLVCTNDAHTGTDFVANFHGHSSTIRILRIRKFCSSNNSCSTFICHSFTQLYVVNEFFVASVIIPPCLADEPALHPPQASVLSLLSSIF